MTLVILVAACSSAPGPRSSTPSSPAATGPVDVPVPANAAPAVRSACAALTSALPDRLAGGAARRPVTGDPARTAAWGDPPVTLRCGVPLPDQAAPPLIIDGLRFVTRKTNGRVLWTTQDRAVNVTLDIPTSYEPQADLVLPLVAVLAKLPIPAAAPGA